MSVLLLAGNEIGLVRQHEVTHSGQYPSADEVINQAVEAMFGKRLVTNVFRSMLVESMIAKVLGPAWNWCAADYASCDFERADGYPLEVKQPDFGQRCVKT